MDFKTCTHVHDTGNFCQSPALTGREYCCFHLRHRGRLMRMAKYRARNERFDLNLPPLENMHAVQSALSQLVEAVAADMIDLKRAQFLLSALRQAATHFKYQDKWQPSAYHRDQSQPHPEEYDTFEAEYGLPEGIDVNTPPEVAFPPQSVILSEERSDESKDPFLSLHRVGSSSSTGNCPPATDNCFSSPMPTVDYCKHGPGCPEHTIRADFPETPETAELREVYETQGSEAMGACHKRQQHNRQRRSMNTARKRYAAIALEKNMRLAAEMLAQRKLAERAAADSSATKKAPASAPDEAVAGMEDAIA